MSKEIKFEEHEFCKFEKKLIIYLLKQIIKLN